MMVLVPILVVLGAVLFMAIKLLAEDFGWKPIVRGAAIAASIIGWFAVGIYLATRA